MRWDLSSHKFFSLLVVIFDKIYSVTFRQVINTRLLYITNTRTNEKKNVYIVVAQLLCLHKFVIFMIPNMQCIHNIGTI